MEGESNQLLADKTFCQTKIKELVMVTKEQIVEAFKKTGLKPMQRRYGDGITCGCALTALYIAAGHSPGTPHQIADWAVEQFGPCAAREIVFGWDRNLSSTFGDLDDQYSAAHAAYCELTGV